MIRLHHRRGFSQTHKDLSTFRSEEPTKPPLQSVLPQSFIADSSLYISLLFLCYILCCLHMALRGVRRVEERGMRGEASGGSACSWEERQLRGG
ncbi:hypothetical protein ES332_A01G047400v1 [Gossypium tomentosum]|uniref:Uncharacterized protein n=1 Tax=Gossypium tomentosum TaxID=34277 RepID=A0A5D2RLM7_GOSTO|nr:hypothetical protein ES332_A01G047400v1 [Gossypium tomentosum]